jgi:hypothetical protein
MGADRIAVESRIACRDEDGQRCTVLRWRRQHDDSDADAAPRWVSYGPALFTRADTSALIQVGGSTLQVVATGMVLEVIDSDRDDVPVLTDVVPDVFVAASARPATAGLRAWTR